MSSRPVTSLYRREEAIGRGNFGVVYKGVHLETKKVVAIKVLNLDTVEDEVLDVQHEITMLARLSQVDNANITKYYGSYLHGTRLWIIMDLCAGGSVRTLLKAGRIEEKYTAVILRELLQALVYIHKEGIIHRDIKAANVLITKEGKVRLCDFGVAAQVTATKLKRSTIVGTPYWMAPEVITEGALYNSKADIWSLGITIFEIATGNPPYSDQEAFRAIVLIPRQKPARLEGPMYSTALKEFVALCLDEHPQERPSAEELMKLKFIKSSRNSPTTILRDLVARYIRWKEGHSNVRDSIAMLNTKPIPENGDDDFDDVDDGVNIDNEDTVWDFDIDPSETTINTMMDFPSSLQQIANGMPSQQVPPPPTLHNHSNSNTSSPTSFDYSTATGTAVGLGLTSDISYPGSQLHSRESTIRGYPNQSMPNISSIPPVPPVPQAPQSLMELFEDASAKPPPHLDPPPLLEPNGMYGSSSLLSSQATTPTVEIEIPTFEAITASATALANSGGTIKPPPLLQSSPATLTRNVPPPLPIIPPPISEIANEHRIQANLSAGSSSSSISLASPPAVFINHPHSLSNNTSPVSTTSIGSGSNIRPTTTTTQSLPTIITASTNAVQSTMQSSQPSQPLASQMQSISSLSSPIHPNIPPSTHRRTPSPKRMVVKQQMVAVPPSPPRDNNNSTSISLSQIPLPRKPSINPTTNRPKLKPLTGEDPTMSPTAINSIPQMVPVGSPHYQLPRPTATKTQSNPNLLRQPSQTIRSRERDLRIAMPPPSIQFTQQHTNLQPPPNPLAAPASQSPPITSSMISSTASSTSDDTLEDIIPPSYSDRSQFPPIPKLDISVLLDSTPKRDMINQLDELLLSLTNGLETLCYTLEECS